MSRLFWLLLAALRNGGRYLRSVLRFSAGFFAGANTAPGLSAAAQLDKVPEEMQGTGALRYPAEGTLTAQMICGDLMAHMVAWLVAPSRFPGRAEADLVIDIQASPAADMKGPWIGIVELVREIEACPGIPMVYRRAVSVGLVSGPEIAPPSQMEALMEVPFPDLDGGGDAGWPVRVSAAMTGSANVSEEWGCGLPVAAAYTVTQEQARLTARLTVSLPTQWVDEKTLYIRQVYEAQWDGDALFLH